MVKNQINAKSRKLEPKNTEAMPKQTAETEIMTKTSSSNGQVSDVSTHKVVKKRFGWLHRPSNRGKYPMPALLRVSCSFLIIGVVSIFLTWFVIWRTNLCDAYAAMEFVRGNVDLAIYSYLVIFGLLALVTTVLWRPFFSIGIVFSILSIVTFIHIQKYTLRNEPLLPEDFMLADTAGDISRFVDTWSIVRLVVGVVCVLIGTGLLEYYMRKRLGRNPKQLAWWNRTAIIPRVTWTMVVLAFMSGIAKPVLNRQTPDWIEGMDLVAWSQPENYEKNGFVIGFIYNIGKVTLEAPHGYSEEKMTEIADKYRAIKAADKTRLELGDEVENIVIILAETFYDPALLTKYYDHYGGDVTPNLHKLFQEYPSGYMYSPEYGGGTANIEFEVQTGLTNYWTKTVPYVNILTKLDSLYSAADWSKQAGFSTTAIHSYSGAMYKRNIVYPILGYEEFIDKEKMKYTEREYESEVYNDRTVYSEIIDVLKESNEPKLVNAVTMQNHAPYQQANYPKMEFPLKETDENAWAIEPSYQSLHTSDKYLGEFIDALDELDEKTVVLWFGDHAMGLLDKYVRSDNKEDRDLAHLTPYFVYANFDIESPYTTKQVEQLNAKQDIKIKNNIRGVDLPTTTPNCLQNTMYNILNLEKPAMFYLLDEVCERTPILANAYYGGESLKSSTALSEYELVSYDMLVGEKYWDGK